MQSTLTVTWTSLKPILADLTLKLPYLRSCVPSYFNFGISGRTKLLIVLFEILNLDETTCFWVSMVHDIA